MRESCGATHENSSDTEHVECRHLARCVFLETDGGVDVVELLEEGHGIGVTRGIVANQAELRNDIARQRQGNEDGGNGVGEGHHAILRNLRVGNALHAANSGVEEDDGRTNEYAFR